MNRINKLFKGAVRERKARKERAHEQDKPKRCKRWLSRLLALFGCLLLVSALVVPCFADENDITPQAVEQPTPPPDGYVPPFGDAFGAFASSIDDRADNNSYSLLVDYYQGYGDARFFDVDTLVSGVMQIANNSEFSVVLPFLYGNTVSDGTVNIQYELDCDAVSFALFTIGTSNIPAVSDLYTNGRLSAILYFSNGSVMLDLSYYNQGSIPEFSFRYNGTYTDQISLRLTSFSYNSRTYQPSDIYNFEFSVLSDVDADADLIPLLTYLFYSPSPYYYKDMVISPYDFYQGFKASYNLGYGDAERYSYQYGYNDGFSEGEEVGFINGYNQGQVSGGAYENGYNKALREIESGDFGRNFLAGVFSAPLEALKRIEIVQWSTADGGTVAISLFTIFSGIIGLSLFVWFLKMFAGG